MAAEGLAEPAIAAGGPALVGLRDDGARRRKRVPAKPPGRLVEDDAGLVRRQRRQRILALARRLEPIATLDLLALQIAGPAGHAKLVLGAVVIGLKLGVAHWPVGEGGVLRDHLGAVALDRLGAGAEIILVQPPGHRAVMHGAAAGLVAVVLHRDRVGARIRVRPPGDRLALDVGPQVLAREVAQLILWCEVLGRKPRPALEPDHLHAGLAKLSRQHATGCADSDNDDIRFVGRHDVLPNHCLLIVLVRSTAELASSAAVVRRNARSACRDSSCICSRSRRRSCRRAPGSSVSG